MTKKNRSLLIIISFLTLTTALIHWYVGHQWRESLLFLNGVGYIVLLGSLLLPIKPFQLLHRPSVLILTLYTIVTFLAYFYYLFGYPQAIGDGLSFDELIEVGFNGLVQLTNETSRIDWLGLGTKAIELILIAVLIKYFRITASFKQDEYKEER